MSPTEQRSANGTGVPSNDDELAQVLDEYLADDRSRPAG